MIAGILFGICITLSIMTFIVSLLTIKAIKQVKMQENDIDQLTKELNELRTKISIIEHKINS